MLREAALALIRNVFERPDLVRAGHRTDGVRSRGRSGFGARVPERLGTGTGTA
jgi:hypothetical protein